MTTSLLHLSQGREQDVPAAVEIVIPVYNEEKVLEASIERLVSYLERCFPLPWVVTIVDNASTDATWRVACQLVNQGRGVQALHLNAKGRGRALRAAWEASSAEVVAYMDVDLSTDLDALLPLVAPLLSGHSDLAIGSRLAPGSRVVRGPKREVISRIYNLLLHLTLHNRFSDAQCGFKAMRSSVARDLLPLVQDQEWFFDTELLVLAEHNGLRIHEIPVDWRDDPDSRVDVVTTAINDLKGMVRTARRLARGEGDMGPQRVTRPLHTSLAGQLLAFGGVGCMTTAIFAIGFVALLCFFGPYGATLAAFAVAAVVNLAANRRVTFGITGRLDRARHFLSGLTLALGPLVVALAMLFGVRSQGWSSTGAELAAVTVANLSATAARFVLLRHAVFGSGPRR